MVEDKHLPNKKTIAKCIWEISLTLFKYTQMSKSRANDNIGSAKVTKTQLERNTTKLILLCEKKKQNNFTSDIYKKQTNRQGFSE